MLQIVVFLYLMPVLVTFLLCLPVSLDIAQVQTDSAGLGWHLRVCISNKPPDHTLE